MSAITSSILQSVVTIVRNTCSRLVKSPSAVLTEADLQAWIFSDLVRSRELKQRRGRGIDVHCQASFLDANGQLGLRPDIVLFDAAEYDVDSTGELFKRKGFTFWGSAIALELKLRRANQTVLEHTSWRQDIDKLKNIRSCLYPDGGADRFFGVFVFMSKQPLPESDRALIENYSNQNMVTPIIEARR